jgi:ABC-2 type transport system ATP-binding protein
VFVSSHLIAEMAVTADQLVIIGRGRLMAQTSVSNFVGRSSNVHVRVRCPQAAELARVLVGHGATVERAADGVLRVMGVDVATVGDLARCAGLALHELVQHEPSLESAYLELTRNAVDHRGPAFAR